MLGLNPNEKLLLEEQVSIIVNSNLTSSKTIIGRPIEIYVDPLSKNDKNKRCSSVVINEQVNEFDNIKLATSVSTTIYRNPFEDEEAPNEKNADGELDCSTFFRSNQTQKNYLKILLEKMFTILQKTAKSKNRYKFLKNRKIWWPSTTFLERKMS